MAESITDLENQLDKKFNIKLKFINIDRHFTSEEINILLVNLTFMLKIVRGEKLPEKESHKQFIHVIKNKLTPTTVFEITYKKFIDYYNSYTKEQFDKRNKNSSNLELAPAGNRPISSDKYEKKYANAKWTARSDRSKIF